MFLTLMSHDEKTLFCRWLSHAILILGFIFTFTPSCATEWAMPITPTLSAFNQQIVDATKAIALNPDNADAYNNRCTAHLQLSQLKEALGDCTKAIALSPKTAMFYANRSTAYLKLGYGQQALKDSTRAIELSPKIAFFTLTVQMSIFSLDGQKRP